MSGAIIYRSRIMDKIGAMNRELTNMEEAVQAQKNNMLLVNEQKSLLCGTSWDSARSYIEEIQIPLLNVTLQYLKAQKEGNHAYQNAAMRLPSVNVLDEDKLEQEQDYWNNRLNREYNREYPRGSIIRRCRNAIREIDSKLLAIRVFASGTNRGCMYESLGERMKTGGTTCDMSSILMSDLVYAVNTDSYEYHISYEGFSGFATPTWSSPELITGSFSVDTQILWHPDGIGGQLYIESYDKLLKKQEELKKKLLLEVLEGGVVTGLTVVNPFAGAGASLVFAAAKESSGDAAIATHSILSESDFAKNQKMNGVLESKTATISVNAVKAWLDYQQANSDITSELARLENERRMNWFGQGGTYAAGGEKPKLVVSGIYNPEVIEKIGIWENQGLKGLLNESGVELPKDTAINEETGFLKSLTEAEKKFWNGEGILAMSAKELEEYSRAVSDKYQKAFENQINIQDLLNPKMGETDHE